MQKFSLGLSRLFVVSLSPPPHQFGHYCPELGAHVDPEQGGEGAGQEGAEHGHVPHVQHPDGQGGHAVDSHRDEEHKRARVILNQAKLHDLEFDRAQF